MEIAISTIAFKGLELEEIVRVADRENWYIEFSSGLPYRSDLEEIFLSAPVRRIPHNYFPAPEVPFVLNLASTNPDIRQRSIAHCKHGLKLSKAAGAPFFSAHAGFCIDPDPKALGRPWEVLPEYDREQCWTNFLDSLTQILQTAHDLGLDFLIENNVVAPFNVSKDGTYPLLCCEPQEIKRLIEEVHDPALGILLDTAHLKVSANALGFDLAAALDEIAPFVRCIHHSDNDGQSDSNGPLKTDYWFLPHLTRFSNLLQVVEVKHLELPEIKKQLSLLQQSN